ncbi:MAG: hypothetical protein E7637_07865 [Ruminococcaceae bacterium]|nr:hypothetical protein [Oscillospiraceae bacterium]
MKKNLKSCIESAISDTARTLVDLDRGGLLEEIGLPGDTLHKKNARVSAKWHFGDRSAVRIPLYGNELTSARYLTFAVFATGGIGGSFSLMLDCGTEGGDGYDCLFPITRDGWNSYRIELPFLHTVGAPLGIDTAQTLVLDCVRAGQNNRTDTVLYLDNFYVWQHAAPRIYVSLPELKRAAVFSRGGSYALIDRKKIAITPDGSSAVPFERDGILWLPMAPVAAGLAHAAVADTGAGTLSFTYRRKKYVFSKDSDTALVGDTRQSLGFSPVSVEGTLFFPASFVADFFHWRQCFTDPTGLVVLSNRKQIFDPVRDEELIRELVMDTVLTRPDGEKILCDLHRTFPNANRARLLASHDELMALRRLAKTDSVLAGYVSALTARYGKKSERFLWDSEVNDAAALRESSDALIAFAMLYRITGDKCYSERVLSRAQAVAAMENWNIGGLSLLGEAAFSMALAYDWCHHTWSEAQKAGLERAMLRNAMRPMLEVYDGKGKMWHTGGVTAATVNAGLLALSFTLADVYPQTSYKLIDRIVRNVEPCFAVYAPDGGHPTSLRAWEKTTRALALLSAMLERACGSDYGFSKAPGFLETADFPIHTETANGSWNYHDAAQSSLDTAMQFWFSRRTGDTEAAWMRARDLQMGKKEVSPFDLLFYMPIDGNFTVHLPLDAVYRKAGLAVMRSDWGADAVWVGLHGGSNRVGGADLDAGSVVLEMGGERFFAETGGDESLPLLLRRRAEGQNTWHIGEVSDGEPDQNLDAAVRFDEMKTSPTRAFATVDMTSVSDALVRAKRGVMLTEDRTVAVIQDELTMSKAEAFTWSVWTKASVKLSPSGRSAILTQNGKRMGCKLCGIGSPARFTLQTVEGTEWSCLQVRVSGKEKLRMAVVCRLLADGEKATEKVYDVTPISRWED